MLGIFPMDITATAKSMSKNVYYSTVYIKNNWKQQKCPSRRDWVNELRQYAHYDILCSCYENELDLSVLI